MIKINKRQEAMLRVMFDSGNALHVPSELAKAAAWYATARALQRRGLAEVRCGVCTITSEGEDWVVDANAAREAHEEFLDNLARDCAELAETGAPASDYDIDFA